MSRARALGHAHWLTLVVGLAAAVPVLIAAIRALANDWTPVGDNAVIAVRAYDVLTPDSPLVGQYSQTSRVLGDASYSLGPTLYWLLAIPTRIGAEALVLTMAAVNTAAIVGTVALARRRGGTALMILVAAAIVVMSGSVVSKVLVDVWNPAASLLPFMLLVFTTWSIAAGDYKLLPLAAVLATFVVQAHLTYLPATVGLLAIAGVGLWAARGEIDRVSMRKWVIAAAVLAAICWAPPLLEQVTNSPGNFGTIVQSAAGDHGKTGFANIGRDAFVRTAGVPPWWLEVAEGPTDRFSDLARPPGTFRIVTAGLVVLALIAVTVAGLRRRRRDVAAAGAQGLVLLAGVTAVASSTPTPGLLGLSLGYTLWWASVAGMFAYVALAWGAAQLLPLPRLDGRRRRVALAALAVAGTVAAVATLVSAGAGQDPLEPTYKPARLITDRVQQAVPEGSTVLVGATGDSIYDSQYDFEIAAVYALRRHGVEVVTRNPDLLGGRYSTEGKRIDAEVLTGRDAKPPAAGAREIARVPLSERTIYVWLVRR